LVVLADLNLSLIVKDENGTQFINNHLINYQNKSSQLNVLTINEQIGIFKFVKIGIGATDKKSEFDVLLYFEIHH